MLLAYTDEKRQKQKSAISRQSRKCHYNQSGMWAKRYEAAQQPGELNLGDSVAKINCSTCTEQIFVDQDQV